MLLATVLVFLNLNAVFSKIELAGDFRWRFLPSSFESLWSQIIDGFKEFFVDVGITLFDELQLK